jgi:predicted ferric reductase
MIRDHNRKAAVYVCGPPLMMKQITIDLKALGYPSRFIHTEMFGY